MALQADELVRHYCTVVEPKRMELDLIFRFLHHSEVELRDAWLVPMEELILGILPELKDTPGQAEQLHWMLTQHEDELLRDAFFLFCAVHFDQIFDFLVNNPGLWSANDEALAVFLRHPTKLPALVREFLYVQPSITDYRSFVFEARGEYVANVGVATEPFQVHRRIPLTLTTHPQTQAQTSGSDDPTLHQVEEIN